MAIIKKDGNFMGLPMNIARGNPIPLDKSEIWYSYEAMAHYAETDPVAYVGQILGLVDEVNGSATAYIILNTDGTLQEVGKATVGDNATIVLKDETLSLRDFGKKYYKYVAATGSEEEGNFVAAKYVAQEVNEQFPWKAGLEPRVVLEGTTYVLGWYEPNPTTMEGVNSQIAGIQTTVDELTSVTGNLSTRVDNTYTKTETDAAIAAAAHLKREIVEALPSIEKAKENIIYMVPNGLTDNDNKYYEYILIDGVFEPVGTWEVDLSAYATQEYVDKQFVVKDDNKDLVNLIDIEKLKGIKENAEKNIINSVSSNFSIDENNNRQLNLISIPATIDLSTNTSLQDLFVKKETDKSLIDTSLITKLGTIEMEAEKNKINGVSNEFTISDDDDRILSLVAVDGSKITNLKGNTEFNTLSLNLVSVSDNVSAIQTTLSNINSSLTTINANFNNYVLKETYNDDLARLENYVTWHEL